MTHAHPDHVGGLEGGAPCPVWATDDTWEGMEGFASERGVEVEVATDGMELTLR